MIDDRSPRETIQPDDSLSDVGLTRRGFVVTTLAVGFALAVRPLSAETIMTATTGLTVGEVTIPTSDGRMPAYRAMPAQGRSCPVVLVVQEIFGVHEHIKDVCRRLASRGYLAIAPELYARQGDVAKMTEIDDIVSKWFPRFPMPKFSQTSTQQWPGSKSQGRAIPASWASRVFAGAGVSCGCMQRTIHRSKLEWRGMGD